MWQMFEASFHTELLPPASQEIVRTTSRPQQDLVLGYWQEVIDQPVQSLSDRIELVLGPLRAKGLPYVVVAGETLDPASARVRCRERTTHAWSSCTGRRVIGGRSVTLGWRNTARLHLWEARHRGSRFPTSRERRSTWTVCSLAGLSYSSSCEGSPDRSAVGISRSCATITPGSPMPALPSSRSHRNPPTRSSDTSANIRCLTPSFPTRNTPFSTPTT